MSKGPEIKVVVHYPKTEDGIHQLSQRVAQAHVDAVIHKINSTRGSIKEKIALMQTVDKAARSDANLSKASHELIR